MMALRSKRVYEQAEAVTLVYGARDTQHNDAVVLVELLRKGGRDR
jgi:uncharacterized protein YeaO (DUF488 family)